MQRPSDPNAPLTVLIGVVGAVLLFVVIVLLQAFFYHQERAEVERKVVAVGAEDLSQLRARQRDQLSSYRWVDAKAGVVAIPIERAMELVVQGKGHGPSVPATASGGASVPGK
jgi:hypothetical protein